MSTQDNILDEILKSYLLALKAEEALNGSWTVCRDEAKLALKAHIASEIKEVIQRIEDSVKNHTVPEGKDLITRSYVLNTLEFECQRAKQKGYDI